MSRLYGDPLISAPLYSAPLHHFILLFLKQCYRTKTRFWCHQATTLPISCS